MAKIIWDFVSAIIICNLWRGRQDLNNSTDNSWRWISAFKHEGFTPNAIRKRRDIRTAARFIISKLQSLFIYSATLRGWHRGAGHVAAAFTCGY
ncbi:MAG TPA: hypothetical protein VEV83_10890 [Parafilimonas sp.]|nr:hypothetical protein [Parafilimonas sp.]